MVLRAPSSYLLGERPHSFGEVPWDKPQVTGLRLSLDGQQNSGTVYTQCMVRGFSDTVLTEVSVDAFRKIDVGETNVEVMFDHPVVLELGLSRYSVEPWLIWIGGAPLRL